MEIGCGILSISEPYQDPDPCKMVRSRMRIKMNFRVGSGIIYISDPDPTVIFLHVQDQNEYLKTEIVTEYFLFHL